MKIRQKLPLTGIIIVSCSLLLLSTVFYIYVSDTLITMSKSHLDEVLEMGTHSFDTFFESRQLEVSYLSKSDLVQDTLRNFNELNITATSEYMPYYSSTNDFFTDLGTSREDLRDIFILSTHGIVLATSNSESLGLDLSDRDYFKNAMKGQPTVSNLLEDRVEYESVLFTAAPVFDSDSGLISGVIATIIHKNNTSKNLEELINPSSGTAFLTDTQGKIVFHVDGSLVGSYHSNDKVARFLNAPASTNGSMNYSDALGTHYLVYNQIPDTPWFLVIEQNNQVLSRSALDTLFFLLVVTVLMVLAGTFIYIRFAKTITEPISHLSQIMTNTIQGDLNARSEIKRPDELGQLSDDFNHMLDKLVMSYKETEAKNEALSAAEEELRYNNEQLILNQEQIKESEEKIRNMAFTHSLTGLSNRLAYSYEIEKYISSHKLKPQSFSVYQMDVDNFMRINESLGHGFGDILLKEIAQRLRSLESPKLKVFHLSADEFAYVDFDNFDEYSITRQLERIYEVFSQPFTFNERVLYLSISTGISTYPVDGDSFQILMQHADTAMFEAKRLGKSSFVFYKKVMSEAVRRRIQLEHLLRTAIDSKRITMAFQPQYSSTDNKLFAFESLMRLKDLTNTAVSPVEFIPVAEDTGHIVHLGYLAIQHAVRIIQQWKEEGYEFSHISINVSGIQLKQSDFVEKVLEILKGTNVAPNEVEFEVTESIFIEHYGESVTMLGKLKQLGFKIALDDFGTGYSSFSYLSSMPLTTLKIDKSFVDNLSFSKKDRDLVRQMIDMSHDLHLTTVAEGVETEAQYKLLLEYGCDFIQGYYFSKPLSLEDAKRLLSSLPL